MPTLTIKGLPGPLHLRLKAMAEAHRRSLNGEIIVCLERAAGVGAHQHAALLAEIDAFRRQLALKPMSDRELRAARAAGRK